MILDNFEIYAIPHINKAYCKCGQSLQQVSNGLLGTVFYCLDCENVYTIKLIKIPTKKLNQDFIDQCRNETRK